MINAYQKIFDHYGWKVEREKLFEEQEELKDELTSFVIDRNNVISELADNYVCLEHVKTQFNISEEELHQEINRKLERTLKEIEE
jgi:hypothetical protein